MIFIYQKYILSQVVQQETPIVVNSHQSDINSVPDLSPGVIDNSKQFSNLPVDDDADKNLTVSYC